MNAIKNILRTGSQIWVKIVIIAIFFTILIICTPIPKSIPNTSDLLVISTVLLAILYGFYVATTFTNYTKLQSLVAEETGKLMAISHIITSIEPKLGQEVNDAIDEYLIASFDVELLSTVEHTWNEFNKIIKTIDKVQNKDNNNFSIALSLIADLIRMRQEFDIASNRVMGIIDWTVMIILVVINIVLLYAIRNNSIVSSLVTVFFSTTLVILLLLLNAVDNNTFAEEKFSFIIYERVFKEIGKLPYYPEVSIKKGRTKPPKETYRIGIYKNLEKSFDKKIKIIKI